MVQIGALIAYGSLKPDSILFDNFSRKELNSIRETNDASCARLFKEPSLGSSTTFKHEKDMKQSTKDNAEGKMHQVKGKVKEVTGKVIDNDKLKAEGKTEKSGGKAQEKVGQVKKVVGK